MESKDIRAKLMEISSATVNRALKGEREKSRLHGTCTTKAAGNQSSLIPVRAYFDWDERNPWEKESRWKMTGTMIKNAEKFDVWSDILQQTHDMDMSSYQKELLKDYEKVYKGRHGGYVQMAKNWEFTQKEMDAAQKLADEGHQIYLLPRNRSYKIKVLIC